MKLALPLAALALAAMPANAARLGQTDRVGSVRVKPLKVVEDSRCPINARCVWAGRLVVRTEIRGGRWRQVRDLELGKPQPVADGTIALVSGEPGKHAGRATRARDYRFRYAFAGGL
jgi:hypothetical protein